ncbi:MAG: hypothetical protein ACTSRU_05105 [Candidatus Hodarchaeales archaeon]
MIFADKSTYLTSTVHYTFMISAEHVSYINLAVLTLIVMAHLFNRFKPRLVPEHRRRKYDKDEELMNVTNRSTPKIGLKQGIASLTNLFFLFWMAIILLFFNYPIVYYDLYRIRDALHLIGMVAILSGIVIYYLARMSPLDPRMISYSLGEVLIIKTSGIYRYLRYPNLLGLLLVETGSLMLIGNSIYFFLIIPGQLVTIFALIESLEKTAIAAFPEKFADYKSQTPWKIFPYVV